MPAEAGIPIFALSARQGLEAKKKDHAEGVRSSGLADIEHYVTQFLAHEKVGALRRAVAAKAAAVLDAAGMEIALGIRALEMPIEDLEHRAAQFGEALRDIERQRLVARDLLAGDRRRAVEKLEEQAATLRREARTALIAVVEGALASEKPPATRKKRRKPQSPRRFRNSSSPNSPRSPARSARKWREFSAAMCKGRSRWLA